MTRAWLRGQATRVVDPRSADYSTGLRLNLPPEFMLIHRVTLGAIGLVVLYFASVMILVLGAVRVFGVPNSDSPAVVFCASHKTLAAGVPMAKLIFAAHPGLGLILLPIMLYHPLQLIVGGVLVGRFQRRKE